MTPVRVLDQRLRRLGLRAEVQRVVTHANRSVMVSLTRHGVLRVHLGYAQAPDQVLVAIVRFVDSRLPRATRRRAERELLDFPVEEHAPAPPARATDRARPGDLLLLHRLYRIHGELNRRHFGGALGPIPIRLSGRMRTRLGELSVDLRSGRPIEIALSRRHITRHPWAEVAHTLLHEMVHQWQAEHGLGVDHGPSFRLKAWEVGVMAQARRVVGPAPRQAEDDCGPRDGAALLLIPTVLP